MNEADDPLASTWALIERAFPDGAGPEDIDPLSLLLYEHMSDRQLSTVIARLSRTDIEVALNRIYRVVAFGVSHDRLEFVRSALASAGFEAWADE